MLTWLTVFSVCSLTIRCRQILRTAPLKAVLFLFCWLGFRLCFAGLRWAYVRFKVMHALCNVSNDFSAMRSFKKEALWAWAAESRWRFLQVTGDHDVTPRRDSLPLVLVPRWRSYFELDKRGNGDTPLQSHTFPMTLTFRWRAWLIPDCVKVGLSFFFLFFLLCGRLHGLVLLHQTRRRIHRLPAELTHLICPFFFSNSRPKAPCHGLRLAQMRNTCCTVFYEPWLNRLSCGAPAGINRLLDAALSSPLGRVLNEKWVKLTRNGV